MQRPKDSAMPGEHSSMLDAEIACDSMEQRQWQRITNDELCLVLFANELDLSGPLANSGTGVPE